MKPRELARLADMLDSMLDAPDLNLVEDVLTGEADFLEDSIDWLRGLATGAGGVLSAEQWERWKSGRL